MQLTGPVFLFLFLPLTLLFVPFCKKRHRRLMLSLFSFAWFLLASWGSPSAVIVIFSLVLVCAGLAALPSEDELWRRVLALLGVGIPLLTFLVCRLLAEYGPDSYRYPYGLTFVVLGAVSYAVDRYRGDAPDRENPLYVAGYMLFFPTIALGPILRYKQYLYMMENARPSTARFSAGARLYMLGYIKRIAVAAVILRALDELLSFELGLLSLLSILAALVFAFLMILFLASGFTDMARGIIAMYGLQPPRAQAGLMDATTPGRMMYGLLLSVDRYFEDYVVQPITRRIGGVRGKLVARTAVFVLTVFFWRMRPEMLLFGLPALIVSCATVKWGRWERLPRKTMPRVLCTLLSAAAVSVFALAMIMDEPLSFFAILQNATLTASGYADYYVYNALIDGKYLAIIGAVLAVLLPLQHFWPRLSRRMPHWLVGVLRALLTLLLVVGFMLALIHLMPQFPRYATTAYGKLFL